MWPGQQPPGGEQNPQNNPYQQPGYQQPNPYQQPGYQQPGPYGQQQPWEASTAVGGPQPPQGGGNRTKLVAIVAALAVVVAAGVTGFLVVNSKKDDDDDKVDSKESASASATSEPSASDSGSDDNPRGNETEKPTVAGWKVVVNPKYGVAYDVPPDWEVQSPTLEIGFEDNKTAKPISLMSGTAEFKSKWCTSDDDKDGRTDDTSLAVVGSKGASGAKDTDEAAVNTVAWWVYGGYTQPDKKSISYDKKAAPYTTTSGLQGSVAWAQSSGTPMKGKCASDGKAVTFGFKNSAGDLASWNFFGAKGVHEEVPKATILKVLSTVRLHGDPAAD